MQAYEELKELGLDDNEVKVYLSCLKSKGSNVKEISQQTTLIRTTVYGVLKSLMNKGLVSQIDKEGILIFTSVNPKELLNILENKKRKIQSIIPELQKYTTSSEKTQKVEFFQGRNGVKTIINDLISKPNQTIKMLSVGQQWIKFSSSFTSVYYRKKKEMKVHTKTILSDKKEERAFFKNKKFVNSEFKFLKNFDFKNTTISIYQDKVSFVSYEEDNARGFIIQDSEYNSIMSMMFDNLWKSANK